MKRLLPILLFVLFCLNFAVNSQNLLTNPGFETWTTVPTGWTVNTPQNVAQNTSLHNEGTSSCRVNATLGSVNISQSITVTAGKTYTFKVSYYIELGDGTDARISSNFTNSKGAIKMSLEDSLALKGPGGNTAYFPNVKGSWQTYSYDVVAPTGATKFTFLVSVAKGGTVSWDNFSFTENTTPTIYPSKSTLTGFTYAPGAGPSAEQSFTVRASNLNSTSSLVINNTSTNFEMSLGTGSFFVATPSMTIANSGGSIPSMTIYVRLKAGLAANPSYIGNITFAGVGATSQTLSLTGSVAAPPVVITPSVITLPAFSYVEGSGPAAQQSFTVSGTGLTAGITVTAPTGYEISLANGSFTGATTFTIPQSGGVVTTTTIYIRLKSGLTAASYTGTLTLASAGGTTKNITLSGTVTPAPGLKVSTNSLIDFSYYLGAGPSTEKSFTVTGTSLSTYIIIIPPTGYEVSTGTGASFAGTNYLVLPQLGTLTTVYVRLMSGNSVNNYTGNISLTSGTYSKTVALTGSVLMSTAVNNATVGNLYAYSSGSGINVVGTAKDELVSLYSTTGIRLQTIKSTGDQIIFAVKSGAVYLVKTTSKVFKIVL